MQPTILVFSVFLDFLQEEIKKIKDPRSKSNATKFKIDDAILSAFSMFFMQSQSFLEYQRQLCIICYGFEFGIAVIIRLFLRTGARLLSQVLCGSQSNQSNQSRSQSHSC